MLEVQNISKSYQDFQALKGINLKVPAQSVFGLLGSNGAGKTTLIRLINQIIDQDEGDIFLDGQKVNTKIALNAHGMLMECSWNAIAMPTE